MTELTDELREALEEETAREKLGRVEDAANKLAEELNRERSRRTEMTDSYIEEKRVSKQRKTQLVESKIRLEHQKEVTRQFVIASLADPNAAVELALFLTEEWGGPYAEEKP